MHIRNLHAGGRGLDAKEIAHLFGRGYPPPIGHVEASVGRDAHST